jgi:hypothetical protein
MEWIKGFFQKQRVNLYDTTAVKQELDKAIVSMVSSDKDFDRDNLYTDLKIVLGLASLGMTGVVYLFSCPAPHCQRISLVSITIFFVLSFLGPWFLQRLEHKAIIIGSLKTRNKIRVETNLGRYDNNFEVAIQLRNNIQQKHFKWTVPYNNYFNNEGTFLIHDFQASFQKFYEKSKANAC